MPKIRLARISNGNWTEWSTIQGVIARVNSKSDERKARGRFEITSTITPWIALHSVQLLLLIIEITISSIVIGLKNSYFFITEFTCQVVIGQFVIGQFVIGQFVIRQFSRPITFKFVV